MFEKLQQKDISGFLTYLWQHDPCKPKWAILAKAYTIIRDSQGKDKTPLDKFLVINAPYINVATPDTYFEQLGWVVIGNEYTIVQRKTLFSINPMLLVTTVSVEDVLRYSYDKGYVSTMDLGQAKGDATMTMVSIPSNISTHSSDIEYGMSKFTSTSFVYQY